MLPDAQTDPDWWTGTNKMGQTGLFPGERFTIRLSPAAGGSTDARESRFRSANYVEAS